MPELYFYGSSGIFLLLPLSYVLYRDIINHNVENKESFESEMVRRLQWALLLCF
jgi:hypothetical protein